MIYPNLDVPRGWSKEQASAVIELLEAIIVAIWELYGSAPDLEPQYPPKASIFDDLPF